MFCSTFCSIDSRDTESTSYICLSYTELSSVIRLFVGGTGKLFSDGGVVEVGLKKKREADYTVWFENSKVVL
jgi:hypothetical protein